MLKVMTDPDQQEFTESAQTYIGVGTPNEVARPASASEVADAILRARERGERVTVRAGGHSMSGQSLAESGLLIDLRLMDEVLVDPETRRVQIGGGARWGQVAAVLEPHGLALTAGDTREVGVGGLTLGGGIGWMVRKFGLAIDSLVAVEAVTADGRIVHASGEENADLFWAVRGGGAGYVVVTRFDFDAHPVSDVTFGTVTYPLGDSADAQAKLIAWDAVQRTAEDDLTTVFSLIPSMGDQPACATLQICAVGSCDPDALVARFDGLGERMSSDVAVKSYATVLAQAEELEGMQVAQRNVLISELTEADARTMAAALESGDTIITLRSLGGHYARIAPDATAFPRRDAIAMLLATRMTQGDAPEPIPDWPALSRLGADSYINFLDTTDTEHAYPPKTWQRLEQTRVAWDPEAIFSVNTDRSRSR